MSQGSSPDWRNVSLFITTPLTSVSLAVHASCWPSDQWQLVESLKKPMQFRLWVSPYVITPKNSVSTDNPRVLSADSTGRYRLLASGACSTRIHQYSDISDPGMTVWLLWEHKSVYGKIIITPACWLLVDIDLQRCWTGYDGMSPSAGSEGLPPQKQVLGVVFSLRYLGTRGDW